jgi:2-oxoglutarate/2-oxoacid ferredoxin oxidoreductase subunit beta
MNAEVKILNTGSLPFCKGCGHDLISKSTAGALEELSYHPLDVILVTDIGCHGIIDKCMNTHTFHGLHGRSAALGAGVSFGIDSSGKKVIVFIGDGGATIGLQHILEAARLNVDMTVVVHNNMLYGMTGGQSSGLTPEGFSTTTSAQGNPFAGYDICALSQTAGAAYVARVAGVGNITENFKKAFNVKGFSLIEVIEICPSYGVKFNPGRKLNEIIESSGHKPGEWFNQREVFAPHQGKKTKNLFDKTPPVTKSYNAVLDKPLSVVMSGSAGEGVQLAATLLCKGAMRSGLHVTQKGSYPVTVGVGFSTAEVNISPQKINFHGIDVPDIVIVTSSDGLSHSSNRIRRMKSGILFIDQSLAAPETGAEVIVRDFRSVGNRNAAFYAALYFLQFTGIITTETIFETIEVEGMGKKLPVEKLKAALEN